MESTIHEDKTFEQINYTDKVIQGREFQSCTFKKCDFSNSDFSRNKFLECTFIECNLSLMKLGNSVLTDVVFKDCKILGVNFSECQDFLFSVSFTSCTLDYALFAGKKMLKTKFTRCSLKEANFTNANLSGAIFEESDLERTIFNRTDLTSANLLTASNYTIDPELNTLKKAVFSLHGLPGLLAQHQIKVVE